MILSRLAGVSFKITRTLTAARRGRRNPLGDARRQSARPGMSQSQWPHLVVAWWNLQCSTAGVAASGMAVLRSGGEEGRLGGVSEVHGGRHGEHSCLRLHAISI
jgi:hypothetical protein